jgi:hypothetical protein
VRRSVVDLAGAVAEIGDPLAALESIHELRHRLEELEEFHVEEALRRGASWDAIGGALGVSRQAAHRRLAARVGGRAARRGRRITITSSARASVRLAREEAGALGARTLMPEHLLLGFMRVGGEAASALTAAGVTLDELRAATRRSAPAVDGSRMPVAPSTRGVFERALGEAHAGDSDALGDVHLLLALIGRGGSGLARVLPPDAAAEIRERLDGGH